MVETMFDYLNSLPQISLSEDDSMNEVKIQQALNIIWHLAEIFMLGSQTFRMKVPSYRLAELGILSDKTAMVIQERIKQGAADMNIITLERKEGGIEITETYREGKTIYNADLATVTQDAPSQLRRDGFTMESFFLKKEDYQINAQLSQGILHPHYHELADGIEIGSSIAYLNGYVPKMKPIQITPKALNTTIALLIEGTGKGRADKYFNARRV